MGCLLVLAAQGVWAAAGVAQAGPFEFHSNFWLNLHHFLYEQALHPAKAREDLTGADKAAWDKALNFYRASMIKHDLLTDVNMQAIDTELAEDETLPKLVVNGEDGAVWETLNSVAAIYRATWWSAHDQANRSFVAAAVPLVQKYSAQMIQQMTTVYESAWPKDAVRVDVAEYANWAGAYTYTYGWGKVHEIMSSSDDDYQGNAALEMLFHEASHGMVPIEGGRLGGQLSVVAKSDGVVLPNDLVHIFIFYTAGELTRRNLGAVNYVPYADKKRLYQDDWARWHNSIAVYWKEHVDGTLSLNDAIAKIVREAGRKSGK